MKNHKKCDACGIGYKPTGRPMKYNLCRTCREIARKKRLAAKPSKVSNQLIIQKYERRSA